MVSQLPILTFHHIGDGGYPPALFGTVLRQLHRSGYRTLDLLAAMERYDAGLPLPAKTFVLTFDDGYLSALEEAAPLLQSLDYTATLFPIMGTEGIGSKRGCFEGKPLLNTRELGELSNLGFSIGSHTLDHQDLRALPPGELLYQLEESKDRLQQLVGRTVDCFAYPYGYLNVSVKEAVRQRFCCACGTRLAINTGVVDRYELSRIDMDLFNRPGLAKLLIQPVLPAYLWARRVLLNARQSGR